MGVNMNELVAPFVLSDQMIEYVLSAYAAFQPPDIIFDEFCACFPSIIEEFKKNEKWEDKLQLAIRELHPSRPESQKKYGAVFASMRRTFFSTIDGERLGSVRARLQLMDKVITDLDDHAMLNPKTFVDCQRLKLDVLKAADSQARAFQELRTGNSSLTEEEIKEMVSQLPPHLYEEFKNRYKEGRESPEVILLDIQKTVRNLPDEEIDEQTQEETTETEQAPVIQEEE